MTIALNPPRMITWYRRSRTVCVAVAALVLISGCANVKETFERGRDKVEKSILAAPDGEPPERAFAIPVWRKIRPEDELLARHTPVFLSEADWSAWNRIGTPSVYRDHKDRLVVRVDPTLPAVYGEQRSFTGASGKRYRNLVYRVHFERVPLRFKPLHVSAGRNSGLYVIVTLNDAGDPLLYTSVHTCGCYLAMVPTDRLAAAARPEDWAVDEQTVIQEKLPGMLVVPDEIDTADRRVAITLRDGSHRVADIAFESMRQLQRDYLIEPTRLYEMSALDKLPVDGGGEASLFAEDDYVRNSSKPLEVALVSWWALDKRVGQDKRLGRNTEDGQVFYTSLKYGDREASDMRDFSAFLEFYGWKL